LNTRRWSYADLADAANISPSMVSHVLNKQRNPGLDFCIGVARAFKIRPEVVLRLAGLLPPLDPAAENEEEMLAIFRSLNAYTRKLLLTMLRNLPSSVEATRPMEQFTVQYPVPTSDEPLGEILRDPENAIRRLYDALTAQLTPAQLDAAITYLSGLASLQKIISGDANGQTEGLGGVVY